MKEFTHTLKEQDGGVFELHRNGTPMICPFRSPVILMNNSRFAGQVEQQIVQIPCDSRCPKFHVLIDANKKNCSVQTNCGAETDIEAFVSIELKPNPLLKV